MLSEPFCQLCNRVIPEAPTYLRKDQWSYLQCPGCGLVLLHPAPDEATLSAYYNGEYQVNFEMYVEGIRRRSKCILADLKEHFPGRGRLLEIGSSYGGFLEEARRDGWDVTGVELNEAAARYSRESRGLCVLSGSLRDAMERLRESYEVVALFHVIEHVRDPVGLLELCRKLIRPGGLLILKTPNVASLIARLTGASWQWVSPPAHLYLFSPATLDTALKKSGYQPVALRSAQGDANNNLFAIVSSIAKRALSGSSPESFAQLRRSLPIRIVERTCEVAYLPLRISIDPWLGGKLQQPELYAVASRAA